MDCVLRDRLIGWSGEKLCCHHSEPTVGGRQGTAKHESNNTLVVPALLLLVIMEIQVAT